MLPRFNRYSVCFALAWVIFAASPALSQEGEAPGKGLGIIAFYQRVISPVDGHRCPMHPSCSAYFKQAIEKHGPVAGWVMGMDRIVRCGRDEAALSPVFWKNGIRYVDDPVAHNDFWWSKP